MSARRTWAGCAAVVAALSFAGCGGGGDDGISVQEKLTVIRARADVGTFCGVYKSQPSELYDRAFDSLLTSVRDLSRIYDDNPDAEIEIPVEKKKLTLEQIVQAQSRALRKCGQDGRQQAGVLDAALQQQQS